jgi:hypothetical protein
MDPLEQIKNIIIESEQNETGENESNSKAKQMGNVQQSRSQSEAGEMPSQNAEVILKGPGVDVIQALLSKIPTAKRPQDDPLAKSSSQKMNFNNMGAATNSNEGGESEENEPEEQQENEEYSPEGGTMIKEKGKKMREHLDALFSGETLSEDFKEKAALIFQAAIDEREETIREEVMQEYESLAEEYVGVISEQVNEQIDSYLGYVVNEWVEENRLQLENGVRLEIAESFIEGLRTLFVEHGIDVPDSDVNLVDQLADNISELEEQLNVEMNRNIELNEAIESYRRNEVIATLGEDLTAAEFDRFSKLCENVGYDSDKNFINKINTIKESYFGETTSAPSSPVNYLSESVDSEEVATENTEQINESMEQYVQTLARFGKK